jgi:hypothetical protein
MSGDILLELEDAALGAKEHLLRHRRTFDAAGRVAEELAQQCGFRHQRLAHHVACGEAIHRIGDRDQRGGADLVGYGGEVGRLLRVGAEENRVARLKQGIDVVMARHHVERMLRDDAGGDLQNEAADFLADRHIVRLERVQDALAR